MLYIPSLGVSLIPSLLNCVINMGGYSIVVEITLDFRSGNLNSRIHQGPWTMEPSSGFQEVVVGKRKAFTLW